MTARSAGFVRVNGAALKHIRQLTGVGLVQLAREAEVSYSHLSNVEAGRRTGVSPAVFDRIVRALRIDDRRTLMSSPGKAGVV